MIEKKAKNDKIPYENVTKRVDSLFTAYFLSISFLLLRDRGARMAGIPRVRGAVPTSLLVRRAGELPHEANEFPASSVSPSQ